VIIYVDENVTQKITTRLKEEGYAEDYGIYTLRISMIEFLFHAYGIDEISEGVRRRT
jgi:hypothetical protein